MDTGTDVMVFFQTDTAYMHLHPVVKNEIVMFEELLVTDVRMARQESRTRWDKVKQQVDQGASIGFRMIKDKTPTVWTGEENISNAGLLKTQTDKWAKLWQQVYPHRQRHHRYGLRECVSVSCKCCEHIRIERVACPWR